MSRHGSFREQLEARWAEGKFVCVGLDSELGKIPRHLHREDMSPEETILPFNAAIVRATKDLVCAYKPNLAFYQRHPQAGERALRRTIEVIHMEAPGVPVILDAKDADIGNTNEGYVETVFDNYKADAVTTNPYLGGLALEPFLSRKDKGVIVLCRTSNPGAEEMQDVIVNPEGNRFLPYYLYVAQRVMKWNKNGNCSVVVGATVPDQLRSVREEVGDSLPILIPGIGAQGGDLEATVEAGKDRCGSGMIINASRSIIFASKGKDFAEAARAETEKLHKAITTCLAPPCGTCGSIMERSGSKWTCPKNCNHATVLS